MPAVRVSAADTKRIAQLTRRATQPRPRLLLLMLGELRLAAELGSALESGDAAVVSSGETGQISISIPISTTCLAGIQK